MEKLTSKAITVEEAIKTLNEAVEADKAAMLELLNFRVPINEKLAKHPTIQCSTYRPEDQKTGYSVSLLGIINGIFGKRNDGWAYISTLVNSNEDLDENYRYKDIIGFAEYNPPKD